MPMRKRTIVLQATIGGLPVILGEFLIQNFATMHRYLDYTSLVCPGCGTVPTWKGGYDCPECGTHYGHHSKLKRIVDITGEAVQKPRLLPPKTKAIAQVYRYSREQFSKKFADAVLSEAGITTKQDTWALNIAKMAVAVERLGQVIVLKWPDTYEERVCLVTLSESNRVILKEIIPANLLIGKETLSVDMSQITEQGITEAKQILSLIPEATDDVFKVSDYRTIGLGEAPLEAPVEAPKVQELSAILAQIQTA